MQGGDAQGLEDAVRRAELVTGCVWCMFASANFEKLVLSCINADFCKSKYYYYRTSECKIGEHGKEKEEKY